MAPRSSRIRMISRIVPMVGPFLVTLGNRSHVKRRPLALWFGRGWLPAGAFGARRLAFHETIAAAVARNAKHVRLQIFVNAKSGRRVFNDSVRFCLRPFAMFA